MDKNLDFAVKMNPELLIWARFGEGMTIEDASEKLRIDRFDLIIDNITNKLS